MVKVYLPFMFYISDFQVWLKQLPETNSHPVPINISLARRPKDSFKKSLSSTPQFPISWILPIPISPHFPISPSPDSQAIETNFYNALPVVLITLIVGSLLPTPAPDTWAAKFGSPLTDLQVFRHLFEAQRGGGWGGKTEHPIGKTWKNQRKTMGKWWFHPDTMEIWMGFIADKR